MAADLTKIPPLSIAVVGAGKIGSAFAFQLARVGGHEVAVVARPGSRRLQQLQHDDGVIDDRNERAVVRVFDALDETVAYDLVLVTVLAHQVEAVLLALKRSRARSIQFMFVNFEPERMAEAVGRQRCSYGMPFLQATLDQDGRLKATIGAGGQKTLMNDQRWVDVFNASGLPAAFEPKMVLWLRCHVPLCIAFESASVAGERRRGGASWSETMVLARGVHESFALIKSLGFAIYPAFKARLDRCPAFVIAAALWLLSRIRPFRELLASGKDECRALVDELAATAVQSKLPISVPKILAMKPE